MRIDPPCYDLMTNQPETLGAVDWEQLWSELDWDNPDRQKQAVTRRLQQRARQYATSINQEGVQNSSDSLGVLTFDLGKERYALDIGVVLGVRQLMRLTRVPGAPAFYRGVVNIRGQIITVLDLRILFNLAVDANTSQPNELLIVKSDKLELAILADHVEDVITIPRQVIEPVDMRYARGVTTDRIVVLDSEMLFNDERLIVGGMDER